MSAIEDQAYENAIFLLKWKSYLTLEVTKESLEAIQQDLNDEQEEATENAHRAATRSKGPKNFHHWAKTIVLKPSAGIAG